MQPHEPLFPPFWYQAPYALELSNMLCQPLGAVLPLSPAQVIPTLSQSFLQMLLPPIISSHIMCLFVELIKVVLVHEVKKQGCFFVHYSTMTSIEMA